MERFQIMETLGDGAFGSVVKAQNLKTGEVVAIKQMKKRFGTWEECISLREIKSLRKFNHPNLIKLKEVVKVKDALNLVFEFLQKDLLKFYSEYKERRESIPEKVIKSIAFQVFSGLAHMHKHGFFHRDMKPENILMSDMMVKIADFGLAREIRSRPPYTEYVSTRWYRAPEILMKSANYNSPVDIFAVGCILTELYLLSPLFNGVSEIDQMYKICQALGTPSQSVWPEGYRLASRIGFSFPHFPPADLKVVFVGMPTEAIEFILEMLKFDSSKRPTAASILNHSYFADTQKDLLTFDSKENRDFQTSKSSTYKSEVQKKLEEIRNSKRPSKDEDFMSDDSDDNINTKSKSNVKAKPQGKKNVASIDLEDMIEDDDDDDEKLENELDMKWKKPKIYDRIESVNVFQNEKTSYSFKQSSISSKKDVSSEREKSKLRIREGINGQGLSGIQKQEEEFNEEKAFPRVLSKINEQFAEPNKLVSKPSFDKKRLFDARINHFDNANSYAFNGSKFPSKNEPNLERRVSREMGSHILPKQTPSYQGTNHDYTGHYGSHLNNPNYGNKMPSLQPHSNFTSNAKMMLPPLRNQEPVYSQYQYPNSNVNSNANVHGGNYTSLPPSLRTVNRRDEILEKYSKYKKY